VRGPGRPKGATNRSTKAWTRYLVRAYGSPLETLVKIATADTAKLAKDHLLDLSDALELQVRAASAALPFMHARILPEKVEEALGRADARLTIVIDDGSVELGPGDDVVVIEGKVVEPDKSST
jgi:hypothetical protein